MFHKKVLSEWKKVKMKVINDLLGYKNLNIVQDTQMFSFSLDSVLLPNFITLNKKVEKILDIGCGNGPIPLILSTKTNAKIIGVEIQPEVAALANESVKLNNLNNQIQIINDDINNLVKNLETEMFDVITCNPPFFKALETSNFNQSDYKTIARHEVNLTIEQVIKISRKLLKNKGILGIVHRPERLMEILFLLNENNLIPKKIKFVYPRFNSEANMVLIEAKKNGNLGLKVLEPLFVHQDNGDYTDYVKKYFENR